MKKKCDLPLIGLKILAIFITKFDLPKCVEQLVVKNHAICFGMAWCKTAVTSLNKSLVRTGLR